METVLFAKIQSYKEYWSHIRSHPGDENDAVPRKTFDNREKEIPIILVPLITLQKDHTKFH